MEFTHNLQLHTEITSKLEQVNDKLAVFWTRQVLARKKGDPEIQKWKILVFGQNMDYAQKYVAIGRIAFVGGRSGVNVYKDKQNNTVVQTELRATTLMIMEKAKPIAQEAPNGE